jgi:mRNA-degrading endonuclease RelE of RelBE toxin-antitoxin system
LSGVRWRLHKNEHAERRGRIRHGDWRAVFEIDGTALVITVLKVGNRKEVYR